jgi:hypothetical protein
MKVKQKPWHLRWKSWHLWALFQWEGIRLSQGPPLSSITFPANTDESDDREATEAGNFELSWECKYRSVIKGTQYVSTYIYIICIY